MSTSTATRSTSTPSPETWSSSLAGEYRRTVTDNPYIRIRPSRLQALFLAWPGRELLYGGAAGGGKSVALLAGALQYAHVPGYAALLLRRTFADLNLPGALIPLSHEWLQGTDAKWDGNEHRWTFPSGASLSFGYMASEADKYRYQSSEFQYIGFDELTQFTASMYLYPFSRLRKSDRMPVPLRVRGATNPGGGGHDWVKARFLDSPHPARRFIPARLEDNPHLDRAAYEESLAVLDPVTRAQLRHGDWKVRPEGNLFKREWFDVVDADRVPVLKDVVRCWDLAATTEEEGGRDWLVGTKMGVCDRTYYVLHVVRDRTTPEGVERLIRRTAAADTDGVKVRIEQEGAASGKIVRGHFLRLLDGYDARFTGIPRTSKVNRAGPFSAACERGDVVLVRGGWNESWLDEVTAFPQDGVPDDQVDSASGAYQALAGGVRQFTPADWSKVVSYR
jgi:predicted phage terminase large subunit-like protein